MRWGMFFINKNLFHNILLFFKDNFFSDIGNWVLWLIVFYSFGTMFYFSLSEEPEIKLWMVIVLSSAVLVFFSRNHLILFACAICFMCFSIAVVNSSFRTSNLLSSKLNMPLKKVKVSGVIKKIYPLEKGKKIILKIHDIDALDTNTIKPKIVQLTVKTNSDALNVGTNISLYADIHPISKTLFPNKYDFSRHSYFNNLDANGFAVSNVKVGEGKAREKSIGKSLESLRGKIYTSLIHNLGEKNGKVASALMIGEQNSVHNEVLEDMRKSGLSHILSVSGLHLSLVSIICFFLVRVALSNFVAFSHKYDIKKIAAVISLASTLFYLLISGMQIATIRSFIMVSFIILAVLLDREDDAKRSLCFAALLILIFMPESIFHPSFQMSFSAVLGLVASYEFYVTKIGKKFSNNSGVFGKLKVYFLSVVFSSFVAGLSTAMFVLYHFNNYSHYSVIANLLSAPIVSFLIMPGVVLTFLLMPFGLEQPGIFVMNIGIEAMLKVAKYIGSLPGSISLLPTIPAYVLVIFVLGFLWLTLWDRKWRILGAIPIALSLAMLFTLKFPSMIIDAKYKSILVKNDDTLLKIGGRNRYSNWYKNQWLSLTNTHDIRKVFVKENHYSFTNNHYLIDVELDGYKRKSNDINSIKINDQNNELIITSKDLEKKGSYFIYLDDKKIRYEYSIKEYVHRPWS